MSRRKSHRAARQAFRLEILVKPISNCRKTQKPITTVNSVGRQQPAIQYDNEFNSLIADHGGQGGIRTRGTLLTYTHFPGVRLKPLGHLSLPYDPAGIFRAFA
jgi:hypothetical protein